MKINFDENVNPFFQVLVKTIDKKITATDFYRKLKQVITEKNKKSSSHKIEIQQPALKDILEDHFLAILLKHSQLPTWYTNPNSININSAKENTPLDVEYDLVVFYIKDDFIFIHSNCNQILRIVEETQNEIFVSGGARFRKLTGQQIDLILSQFNIEYRSLGIQNYFGLGGSAPEGKTYHGKDTSTSLTPSFDTGYGFSYCIAAIIPDKGRPEPFGCSKNKSKIWTTWVKDLNIFIDQCDKIVKWLNSKPKANIQLDVLVKPVSKLKLKSLRPIEFFLDYYIMERGMVFLGKDGDLSTEWTCNYDDTKDVIEFMSIHDGGVINKAEVDFKYNGTEELYDFSYIGSDAMEISVHEPQVKGTGRNTEDLVLFLNNQQNFTILFDQPFAYRSEECWEDNRLSRLFLHGSKDISWSGVDITKEDKAASPGQINILQAIEKHFSKDPDVLFSCNDNGANEVADYIVLFENRIILIHAKYATKSTASVIIGDIQVVASQAVKNNRFFLASAYSDKTLQRIYANATGTHTFKNFTDFKERYLSIIRSKDTIKECWIVQPGISLAKLKAQPANKMHTILNFLHSVLKVNGVEFMLMGS